MAQIDHRMDNNSDSDVDLEKSDVGFDVSLRRSEFLVCVCY